MHSDRLSIVTEQRIGDDYVAGLPLPDVVQWPIFPFKGDMEVRTVRPFSESDHPRSGEPDGPPCACTGHPDAFQPEPAVWANDRWVVRPIRFGQVAAPFPAYMLETVAHMDFEDFDDELAADYGVMCVRLERAIRATGSVGRVHMNRWGDGGSHFHVWFLARPLGAAQLSGFMLPLWGFALPPLDEQIHEANDAIVAAELTASEEA